MYLYSKDLIFLECIEPQGVYSVDLFLPIGHNLALYILTSFTQSVTPSEHVSFIGRHYTVYLLV